MQNIKLNEVEARIHRAGNLVDSLREEHGFPRQLSHTAFNSYLSTHSFFTLGSDPEFYSRQDLKASLAGLNILERYLDLFRSQDEFKEVQLSGGYGLPDVGCIGHHNLNAWSEKDRKLFLLVQSIATYNLWKSVRIFNGHD